MMLDLIVETTTEPVTKETVLNITTSDNLDLKELHFLSLFLTNDWHTAMVKGKDKSKSIASSGLAYDKEQELIESIIDPKIGNSAEDGPVNNDTRAFKEVEQGGFVDGSLLERVQKRRVSP
jgi:hypothetical protein